MSDLLCYDGARYLIFVHRKSLVVSVMAANGVIFTVVAETEHVLHCFITFSADSYFDTSVCCRQ